MHMELLQPSIHDRDNSSVPVSYGHEGGFFLSKCWLGGLNHLPLLEYSNKMGGNIFLEVAVVTGEPQKHHFD